MDWVPVACPDRAAPPIKRSRHEWPSDRMVGSSFSGVGPVAPRRNAGANETCPMAFLAPSAGARWSAPGAALDGLWKCLLIGHFCVAEPTPR